MKSTGLMLCGVLLALPLFAGTPVRDQGSTGFEKMKSLEGVWDGKDPDGNPVRVSYKTVSAGTAIMETIDHDKRESVMVTMYHLDHDKLMMTHYCSMGNQPRMRLTAMTPSSLSFSMFDATNHTSKNDPIMDKLVITWTDRDHIAEEWTAMVKGKDSEPHLFKLSRTN